MKLSKLLKYILTPFMFQFGIDQTDDGETIGTGNDARLKMFNDIADNNDKGRASEFFEEDEEGNRSGLSLDELKTDDEDEEEEPLETSPEEEEEEPETSTGTPEKKPLTSEPKKYKIKVNGVEKEVDESWLLETAQKVDSADDYLREAARLNNDAKALRKPAQEETKPEVEEIDDVTLARQIQMGSEEEAAAAIRKLRSPTGPSSDDLARTIDERLTFQKSVDWFKEEYKDIVSDPVLNAIAVQQDNILRSQGDKRSYVERYKAIGDGIRGWLEGHRKGPETEVQPEPETKVETAPDKKARKAAAPSVPKSAANKVKEPEVEESEESVQDTIANMAKSRGGPQWMRG